MLTLRCSSTAMVTVKGKVECKGQDSKRNGGAWCIAHEPTEIIETHCQKHPLREVDHYSSEASF